MEVTINGPRYAVNFCLVAQVIDLAIKVQRHSISPFFWRLALAKFLDRPAEDVFWHARVEAGQAAITFQND